MLQRWVPDENDMMEKVEARNGVRTDKDRRLAYVPLEVRFPHGFALKKARPHGKIETDEDTLEQAHAIFAELKHQFHTRTFI